MSQQRDIKQKERQLTELEAKTSSLYGQLKRMRRKFKLVVSDHAIVRYLERIENVPVSQVSEKLITVTLLNYYYLFGDGTYPIGEGSTRVVIKEGTIVTVIK